MVRNPSGNTTGFTALSVSMGDCDDEEVDNDDDVGSEDGDVADDDIMDVTTDDCQRNKSGRPPVQP